MYREHHVALYGLGDRHRGLLYGAVALGCVRCGRCARACGTRCEVRGGTELVQVHRWDGLGESLWFVLAGLVVYSLLAVYRHARAY